MTQTVGPRLIERTVDVLFAVADGPKTFTGVCGSVGLSKTTVHRILAGLSYKNLVVLNPSTGEYMLGAGGYHIARALSESNGGITPIVQSVLVELSQHTQETVILHARVGSRRVCIEEVESPQALRYTAGVGTSAPLHIGSAGKVLAAWMDEDQLRRVLPSRLETLTDASITNWELLLKELSVVRSQGWAESHGERVPGAFAISAPIFDDLGNVAAAVSVLGPEARLSTSRLAELRGTLVGAAAAATALLGGTVTRSGHPPAPPF